MLGYFFTVLGQVSTLFFMIAVGFVMGKRDKLSEATVGQLSTLLLSVVTPCVIITLFQIERTEETAHTLVKGLTIIPVIYLALIVVSLFLFPKADGQRRPVLRFAAIYNNAGFMGLPLVRAIFGEVAALPGVLAMVCFNIFCWAHGAPMMGGKFSLKGAFLNPGMLGLAAGALLFFTQIAIPTPLLAAMKFMADVNTPLAMVVVGAQLSRVDMKTTFTQSSLYWASLIRLVLIPAAVSLVLIPLNLEPVFYGVCVISLGAPTAGATAMFAQRFGRDQSLAAQAVALTTIVSLVTLPFFAVVVRMVTGI